MSQTALNETHAFRSSSKCAESQLGQKELPLVYQGVKIDCAYRADLIVEEAVVVEVKAIESLAPIHSRQLLTYLRIADLPVGLLLNFGAPTMKQGIKRVANNFKEG
jgi:GxxExxY protein